MKRLALLLSGLLLLGCAGPRKVSLIQPVQDPASYRRLGDIGARVIPVIDFENRGKYEVAVVDSEEVNAWTTGGKNFAVFFTRGALERFSDEEITFIYAHEVSHVKLGHVEKRIAASVATTTVLTVAGIFIPGAGLLDVLANPIVTSAFSRPQEMEADKLAVTSIQKCCQISKGAAIGAHEKLLDLAKAKGYKEEDRSGILDTHPSLEERIRRIREMP